MCVGVISVFRCSFYEVLVSESFFVSFQRNNNIGADGIVAVAEALRGNSTLQRLEIVRM